MRTGDWAILAGAAAVAAYERCVRDDADLISNRVAAYRRAAPALTYAVVWITALHLTDNLPPNLDPYHWLVRYFRRRRLDVCIDTCTDTR